MKIYLSTYALYNNNSLQGKWIDLPLSEEELHAEIKELFGEGDHEIMIQDSEGFPDNVAKESTDIFKLNSIAESLANLNETELLKVEYLLEGSYTLDQAIEKQDEVTVYLGMSLEDVAIELVEDGCFGNIPDSIANYIDYKAIAHDLSMDGYVEHDGNVYRID